MEINIYVVALWVTAVLAILVAFYALRHRHDGEWTTPFIVVSFATSWWLFWYGMEIAVQDLTLKIIYAQLEYLSIAIISVVWFVFAIRYTGRVRWWTFKKQLSLFVVPIITIIIVFSNQLHRLNWATIALDSSGQFPVLDVTYGIWFWIHSAYSYFFLLAATFVLVQGYFRFPPAYRRQHATLLMGALIPLLANAIYLAGLNPFPNLDLSPFGLAISVGLVGISVFGLGLFNIVPVARRVVVDNMKAGMIVLDLNAHIVDINPAAAQLFPQDNLIGQSITDLLQNRPDILDSFRGVKDTEAEIEAIINGEWRVFEIHISPIQDKQGTLNGRLIVFYDITERKITEAALAQARDDALEAIRVKTEMLARVSHELRTPLNVILGYTEMLQEGLYGQLAEAQWEPTNKIIESTSFLTKQVNELLDISRLEIGQLELELEWFYLTAVVQRVHSQMKVLANARQLQLTYEVDPQLNDKIYNDLGRIEQVLLNLVSNAIKFSKQGHITIKASLYDEAHWTLQVIDEGLGIPESAQAMIFEPFRRVDSSLVRTQIGTGLGLAIVKQLVTLMQGHVQLESRVGEGSTFTIIFPFLYEEKVTSQ